MYAHILIPTDGSEVARRGMQEGLTLASAIKADVSILTVSEPWPIGFGVADQAVLDEWERDSRAVAKAVLESAGKAAADAGVGCKTAYVPEARPADAIVEYVERHDIDLIVMASHGRRGFRRLMLGSQTSEVLSRSPVPVLVIR